MSCVSKVVYGDDILIDLTSDTVDIHAIKAGYTAHTADGSLIEGKFGKAVSFAPGSTFVVNVSLRDGKGYKYSMVDGDVLKLHIWRGTFMLDAESVTTALSVDIPTDADEAMWQYWITLVHDDGEYLVALGDAHCEIGGDALAYVAGVMDTSRKFVESVADTVNVHALSSQRTSVNDYAYMWLPNLTLAYLPSATTIGTQAFYQASSLRMIYLPSATTIGRYAFYADGNITSLDLPSVTRIENDAFYSCFSIKSVCLPSLISIGDNAFKGCYSLTLVYLPSVTTIGSSIFYACSSLETLILGASEVCQLAASLGLCKALTSIYVNDDLVDEYKTATNWSAYTDIIKPISDWDGSIPDSTVISDYKTTEFITSPMEDVFVSGTYSGDYVNDRITKLSACFIMSDITSFSSKTCRNTLSSAFHTCKLLKSVDLPVCTYCAYASFASCISLTDVNLPALRDGGSYLFSSCTALTKIRLPNLSGVPYALFSACTSLTALILPGSFVGSAHACSVNLERTPILSGTGYVYVPRNLVDKYKTATNWSAIADQFRAIEDYPEICGE